MEESEAHPLIGLMNQYTPIDSFKQFYSFMTTDVTC